MAIPKSFKLNTGADIPAIGLGTWQSKPGEVASAVAHALQKGYRHVDCAYVYQNEEEVGQGIKASGVKREDIFLTSKLWLTHQDRVEEGLELSLRLLGTTYLDLYLVHWPLRVVKNGTHDLFPTKPDGSRNIDYEWDQAKTWAQMEALLETGKVKAIGLSNASIITMEHLAKTWKIVPAVNQIELHPYCPQHAVKAYCEEKGILLEAYSPLGSTGSPIAKDPEVIRIAKKHNVETTTVLISYNLNRGCVVLPKSVTPSRIQANLAAITLDAEDMVSLNGLAAAGKQQRVNTPPYMTDFGFPDFFGPGNREAPEGARLLAGKAS